MPKAHKPDTIHGQSALDAEKTIIGLLVAYPTSRPKVLPSLTVDDFQLTKHRQVFQVVADLYSKGLDADRLIIWDVLARTSGNDVTLSDLVSFEEGLPDIPVPDSYVRILKDYRSLRKLHVIAQEFGLRIDSQHAPLDIITELQAKLLEVERESPLLDTVPVMAEVVDRLGGVLEIISPTNIQPSIKTGWKRFDAMSTGLELGTLTIIAGRPSMGKSAAMMCMMQNIAESGVPVAVFSMEMSKRSLLDRMICVRGGVNFTRYRTRSLGPTQLEDVRTALEHVYDLPIFIDDKSHHSVGELSRKIDRLVNKHGVKVVALDFAQLLTSGARQKGDRRSTTEVLGEAVEALKGIAKRLNIAFVLLSQLSRDSDKRAGTHKPVLSDLRDSGALEQVADLVCFVWREIIYKPDQAHLINAMELIVGKQRNGSVVQYP